MEKYGNRYDNELYNREFYRSYDNVQSGIVEERR